MSEPWDVAPVRQTQQYQSFMRINGVPLLPPVLTNECRQEMQYYKLLAKEVEKRIKCLTPYIAEETIDADDADELESSNGSPKPRRNSGGHSPLRSSSKTFSSNVVIKTTDGPNNTTNTMKIDFNVSINNNTSYEQNDPVQQKAPIELPERDYDCKTAEDKTVSDIKKDLNAHTDALKELSKLNDAMIKENLQLSQVIKKDTLDSKEITPNKNPNSRQAKKGSNINPPSPRKKDANVTKISPKAENAKQTLLNKKETNNNKTLNKKELQQSNLSSKSEEPSLVEEFLLQEDGPCSLSKSFTGSLQDVAAECEKESPPGLVRQRSYTILNPSPVLMAHLKVQSLNTGVDMTSISMSETNSNMHFSCKKRRSWDLETAKSQWTSMAKELMKYARPGIRRKRLPSPTKDTLAPEITATNSGEQKKPIARNKAYISPKSEPIQKPKVNGGIIRSSVSERNNPKRQQPTQVNKLKNHVPPKVVEESKELVHLYNGPISGSDDPATKVRELYEKIQKQQVVQMASLLEKQRKEQQLLQQLFEEQNNLLFKQLKTICPTDAIEAKQAWGDEKANKGEMDDEARGPVSLSQLINQLPGQVTPESPIADTQLANIRCKTATLRKNGNQTSCTKTHQNSDKSESTAKLSNASCTPTLKRTSRRLIYEKEVISTDYDCDVLLTDRTGDTMADLNVTFPTDNSDIEIDSRPVSPVKQLRNSIFEAQSPLISSLSARESKKPYGATDYAINDFENSIRRTMNAVSTVNGTDFRPATAREREAATKIVAYAKGYLVRRLMRTERVQTMVATIRDALLCALELHQDREGIRGADVDLHRRLIQQITAACYQLHDTFITSSPAERCSAIASDRARRATLSKRSPPPSASRISSRTVCQSDKPSGSSSPTSLRRFNTLSSTLSNETVNNMDQSKCKRRPWR